MAKRFVFRLETLLKLRRQREDRQKRVVAERLRQITRVQHEIGTLERQIGDQIQAMRAEATGASLDVPHLARSRHWLSHLQRGRLEAEGHLRLLEARLAQERAVLTNAVKDRRVLEKLRERQEQRHRRELDRIEMLASDESNTVRFLLDRRESEADEP